MTGSDAPWRQARQLALRSAAAKATDPRLGLRIELWRALGRFTHLPLEIDFRTGGNSGDFAFGGGWSKPEAHGRWTVGPAAQIAAVLEPIPVEALAIEIELSGVFTAPRRLSQTVAIDVNGVEFAPWRFDHGGPHAMRRTLLVPADAVARLGAVLLTLDIAASDAPYFIGAGEDTRDLGIAVRRVAVDRSQAK